MSDAEAEGLLSFLKKHIVSELFCCRLKWTPGTFVIWDNRLCIHQAYNDYDGYRRLLYRTTAGSERPYGAA